MAELADFQKATYLPPDQRKKILLLSDDLRMSSGVGTVSKYMVRGLVQRYNFVQVGAAIKHPDEGKIFDLKDAVKNEWGLDDGELRIYASSGYGNPDMIRDIMMRERPDAILHFTDPRFWVWLYQMEHEIRTQIPLFFYHIWDDLPYPMYNRNFYESCDWIGCISKQTYNIVQNVWGSTRESSWKQPEDWQVSYVPHGINSDEFYPIKEDTEEYKDMMTLRGRISETVNKTSDDIDFIVFWSNRNIRRKMPGDVVLAYKTFCDSLPKEKADRCLLLMHTAPIDDNGTDLYAVAREVCPDYSITFSDGKMDVAMLNKMYNLADVTINIASNEGFGLTTCESIMAGTPITVNVTGGLQDQCGFKDENGNLVWVDDHFNKEWGSNHDGRYKKCGSWVKPVWPETRSLVGSPPTPYIFDDRAKWEDVAKALEKWYSVSRDTRKKYGREGRRYCLETYPNGGGLSWENMCMSFINGMDTAWNNWKPRDKFELIKLQETLNHG